MHPEWCYLALIFTGSHTFFQSNYNQNISLIFLCYSRIFPSAPKGYFADVCSCNCKNCRWINYWKAGEFCGGIWWPGNNWKLKWIGPTKCFSTIKRNAISPLWNKYTNIQMLFSKRLNWSMYSENGVIKLIAAVQHENLCWFKHFLWILL